MSMLKHLEVILDKLIKNEQNVRVIMPHGSEFDMYEINRRVLELPFFSLA